MKQEYECEQIPLIVYVPNNTVSLTLECKVIEDDETMHLRYLINENGEYYD